MSEHWLRVDNVIVRIVEIGDRDSEDRAPKRKSWNDAEHRVERFWQVRWKTIDRLDSEEVEPEYCDREKLIIPTTEFYL